MPPLIGIQGSVQQLYTRVYRNFIIGVPDIRVIWWPEFPVGDSSVTVSLLNNEKYNFLWQIAIRPLSDVFDINAAVARCNTGFSSTGMDYASAEPLTYSSAEVVRCCVTRYISFVRFK